MFGVLRVPCQETLSEEGIKGETLSGEGIKGETPSGEEIKGEALSV